MEKKDAAISVDSREIDEGTKTVHLVGGFRSASEKVTGESGEKKTGGTVLRRKIVWGGDQVV